MNKGIKALQNVVCIKTQQKPRALSKLEAKQIEIKQ